MATRRIEPWFLDDEEFRHWFAERSVHRPSGTEDRTDFLTGLNEDLRTRIEAIEDENGHRWQPRVEILRTLALFFPEDLTALAVPDNVVSLAREMGCSVGGDRPVMANRLILERLRRVLGPPPEGLEGVAERMLLPTKLYSLVFPKLWVVRAGKGGEDEEFVLTHDLLLLGFVEENEPKPEIYCFKEYRELIRRRDPDRPRTKADSAAGQVWAFAWDIGEGDIVILPQKRGDRLIAWGTVEGEYRYREVDGRFRHTRPVKWVRTDIRRGSFGNDEKYLNQPPTVFSLRKHAESFRQVIENGTKPVPPLMGDLWEAFSLRASEANLQFDRSLVEALHLGLWADEQRHFAILSGLSGTGKTQIALRYAMALTGAVSDTGGPVEVIAVHPGWHDPGPLLGYVNPLTDGYARTEFLNFLLEAAAKPDETHVLILDEMNLSHPEQYFAPILSAMEIPDGEIPLHRGDAEKLGVPTGVPYPKNLVLIGTVNMDETTMGISDKVLDRAFTLEFWDIEPEEWPGWESCGLDGSEKAKVRGLLAALTRTLSPARRHFGWRVIAEVVGFLEGRSRDSGIEIGPDAALDQVIYAKVLPKLRGSDTPRFRKCLDETAAALERAGLEMCARKVRSLKEDLDATGSCSFWR